MISNLVSSLLKGCCQHIIRVAPPGDKWLIVVCQDNLNRSLTSRTFQTICGTQFICLVLVDDSVVQVFVSL
jgi:hypothetical protein